MQERGAQLGGLLDQAEELQTEGQTILYVASEGRAAGFMSVADPVRASTAGAIEQLKQERDQGADGDGRQSRHGGRLGPQTRD